MSWLTLGLQLNIHQYHVTFSIFCPAVFYGHAVLELPLNFHLVQVQYEEFPSQWQKEVHVIKHLGFIKCELFDGIPILLQRLEYERKRYRSN